MSAHHITHVTHLAHVVPLVLGFGGLAVGLVALPKVVEAFRRVAEVIAAVIAVVAAIWLGIKITCWAVKTVVTHWRTTLALAATTSWCWRLGWPSLAVTVAVLAVVAGVWLAVDRTSFDRWVGKHLRAVWLRHTLYARRLPGWLHACGLTVVEDARVDATAPGLVKLRGKVSRSVSAPAEYRPKLLRVRSGASWDQVQVRLVDGQTPEDFDEATRALAVARNATRCQVREISPKVVSIDFQRRNLLQAAVPCGNLDALSDVDGAAIDLSKVEAGRTEYGQPWHISLVGSHTLCAGETGAGKGSMMWAPLVSIAPAIRDGLVRVSGVDPKGMELAYGRGIFTGGYAVTAKDTITMLDDLVARMEARKAKFAGRVRTVDITRETPLELLEFDELGALTKYTSRQNREKIIERIALLNTQGRALGFSVRGYVQEPSKDTVPVRELFPRRLCLRVPTKSHVGMALGDQAYARGAWANRIGESEPGVGYLFGEGIREALRVRAAWVDDPTVKALEAFVLGVAPDPEPVHATATRLRPAGVTA